MKAYRNWALIISSILHIGILTKMPPFLVERRINRDDSKRINNVELIPQKISDYSQMDRFKETPPPPFVDNFMQKLLTENKKLLSFNKPQIMEEDFKGIILTEIPQESTLRKMPVYMNYYRLIREKIRSNAYRYYQTNDRGEVFLSFVILKDGHIDNLNLDEESVNNFTLREVALNSVKNASPFPAFPAELEKYVRLQFNISIYFKNN